MKEKQIIKWKLNFKKSIKKKIKVRIKIMQMKKKTKE